MRPETQALGLLEYAAQLDSLGLCDFKGVCVDLVHKLCLGVVPTIRIFAAMVFHLPLGMEKCVLDLALEAFVEDHTTAPLLPFSFKDVVDHVFFYKRLRLLESEYIKIPTRTHQVHVDCVALGARGVCKSAVAQGSRDLFLTRLCDTGVAFS